MTRYLGLSEYLWLAEQVTGIEAPVLAKAGRMDLADSALHAPEGALGGVEFYPDLIDKAAVLLCRLAWNHPLPDGNKRSAWAALVLFLDLNGVVWEPDPPNVRGHQPVLRTNLCGGLHCFAAAIVEGDCDIEGTVGRLVDDVELQRVEQRPQFALGRRVERGGKDWQAVK
jgi:death-on-curing protein